MELSITQALQQGVAAHQAGNLQGAERLYRAILQAQPNHVDANHNLGVLAVSVGKPLEALPFFEKALEINPQIEQFWLSYVGALINAEKLDEVRSALKDAQQAGVSPEKLQGLREKLEFDLSRGSQVSPQETNKLQQSAEDELSTASDLFGARKIAGVSKGGVDTRLEELSGRLDNGGGGTRENSLSSQKRKKKERKS